MSPGSRRSRSSCPIMQSGPWEQELCRRGVLALLTLCWHDNGARLALRMLQSPIMYAKLRPSRQNAGRIRECKRARTRAQLPRCNLSMPGMRCLSIFQGHGRPLQRKVTSNATFRPSFPREMRPNEISSAPHCSDPSLHRTPIPGILVPTQWRAGT